MILALGSVNADFQVRVDADFDVAAIAHGFRRLGRGKAANVAYFSRMFGRDGSLFGRVGRAVTAARGRGLPIVLDPSFPERVDRELLRNVDAITPNESEARHLGRLSELAAQT